MQSLSLFLTMSLCLSLPVQAITFTPEELASAKALQQRMLTLDSHLDTPANLHRDGFSITGRFEKNALSQVDYPRMLEGALDGGFWAIYTAQGDRSPAAHRRDRQAGLLRMREIHQMLAAHPDKFALALNPADAVRIKAEGRRVVFISMENASPLVADPSLLSTYYRSGLRMLGLVHFDNNEFADSSTAPNGQEWKGLSPAGRALVNQAVKLGIVIDQSHASDAVFDELIKMMPVPFVLSHGSSKAIHNHPRNTDDARLRRLAKAGGVIQINSFDDYLLDTNKSEARRAAEKSLMQRLGGWENMTIAQGRELYDGIEALDKQYSVKNPSMDEFFDHLGHILDVVGPEHVGIGMDWDGGGGLTDLPDVSELPKITAWLLRRGYSEQQIAGIWGGNVLRVMQQAQDYATR